MRAQLVEKTIHRRDLRRSIVDRIDLAPKLEPTFEIGGIPPQMLACDAHATLLAVKRVVVREVLEDEPADLRDFRRWKHLAMVEEVTDLAEDPRASLRRASDHYRVRAGMLQHVARHFRRVDIPIGRHRHAHGLLHRPYGVVLDSADETTLARTAVNRERRDAGAFGDVSDAHRVSVLAIPPGADLQRHGNVDRIDHALDNSAHQRFVLHQRGPRGDVTDLLRRTAHVDVDDLRASIDVIARRIGHLRGIGAGDLHDDRLDLAVMIHSPLRLARIPKLRIRRYHL